MQMDLLKYLYSSQRLEFLTEPYSLGSQRDCLSLKCQAMKDGFGCDLYEMGAEYGINIQ